MTQFVTSLLPFAVLTLLWVLFVGRLQRRLAKDSNVGQSESQAESLEPHDAWNRSGEIHTYRDPDVLRHKAPFSDVVLGALLIGLFLVLPVVAIVGFASGFTLSDRIQGAVALGLFLAIVCFGDRRHRNQVCGEIRLAEDGTCELESKRRMIRLHVGEIQSVSYWRDSENEGEHYTIYYRGGKVRVTRRMKGFLDFLTRLKALNPSVDLSSFPAVLADTWPGVGGPATEERGTLVNRFFRGALFPLIVVSLLVYLASQTLLGK